VLAFSARVGARRYWNPRRWRRRLVSAARRKPRPRAQSAAPARNPAASTTTGARQAWSPPLKSALGGGHGRMLRKTHTVAQMSKEPDDDGGDEGSKKGAVFVCVCARRNGQFKLRTQQSIVHAFPRTISTPPPAHLRHKKCKPTVTA
jgi:hypothetical protein